MKRKVITIEVDVDGSTEDTLIEYEVKKFLEKIKKFCQFQFWKGNEAVIKIEDGTARGSAGIDERG